jgi:Ca-activated chloride channel family protein
LATYAPVGPGGPLAAATATYGPYRPYATPQPPVSRYGPPRVPPPSGDSYWNTYFQDYGTNPFLSTEDLRFSTFAVDVDTASYTIARSYLQRGALPPADAVRAEEFINYFDPGYPAPDGTFGIYIDGARSRFGEENKHLLRVGIRARDRSYRDRRDAVLTFVVDVSGSMDIDSRIGLAQRSLERLVDGLGPDDKVGIVAYNERSWTVIEPTSDKVAIRRAIGSLRAGGSTNADAGLRLGYEMASRAFAEGRTNRVVLISDGVANTGATDPTTILDRARRYANDHITLTTIGVGMGNFNDVLLEQLADRGDGSYFYIDDDDEAKSLFGQSLTGVLEAVAADVKVQVEFNPDVVDRYRLIGYENRALETEDFRDNSVDAGEVGAGHTVTALYEVRLRDDARGEAATVSLRWLDPETKRASEMAVAVEAADLDRPFEDARPQLRFIAAVAEFAEILRESFWAQDSRLDTVRNTALAAIDDARAGAEEREFAELVRVAGTLRR